MKTDPDKVTRLRIARLIRLLIDEPGRYGIVVIADLLGVSRDTIKKDISIIRKAGFEVSHSDFPDYLWGIENFGRSEEVRKCRNCNRVYAISEYYDTQQYYCRYCMIERARDWKRENWKEYYQSHKERLMQENKRYRSTPTGRKAANKWWRTWYHKNKGSRRLKNLRKWDKLALFYAHSGILKRGMYGSFFEGAIEFLIEQGILNKDLSINPEYRVEIIEGVKGKMPKAAELNIDIRLISS